MSNYRTFKLDSIYNLNFNKIKSDIKNMFNDIEIDDYNSIIIMKFKNPTMGVSINQICKIDVFLTNDNIENDYVSNIIKKLEYIIKLQVDDAYLIEK